MTLAVWPASLPKCPDLSSWALTPIGELSATDFEQGPSRRRRRFTAMRHKVSLRPRPMTAAEFRLFKGFYFGTLNHGADDFTMPVYDGEIATSVRVRFDEEYNSSNAGSGRTTVSFTLIVLDLPVLDAASMEFLLSFTEADALAWSASLHEWVNVTYPAAVAPYAP